MASFADLFNIKLGASKNLSGRTKVRSRQVDSAKARSVFETSAGPRPRYVLINEGNLSDFLRFHYNPTDWDDAQSAIYDDAKTPGTLRGIKQYKGGGDRVFPLKLFLADTISGRSKGDVVKSSQTPQAEAGTTETEAAINWLQSHMQPLKNSASGVGKIPPTLLFVPGGSGVFRVVITELRVKRTFFDPQLRMALRADVELTLQEVVDTVEAKEAQENTQGILSGFLGSDGGFGEE